MHTNRLTGPIPASIGNCTKLQNLRLDTNNLSGSVPASAVAKLTQLKQLALYKNENLTITEAEQAQIQNACAQAKFWWPTVV